MKIVVTGTRGIPNIMGGVETHPHIVSPGFCLYLCAIFYVIAYEAHDN